MLEALFNSKNREKILIFLLARNEGYAREISKYYNTSLSPIQNQLDKLENGSILVSKSIGKTRVYYFNPRYPFLKELIELLKKAIEFLPDENVELLYKIRKRPRRKGKPI